MNVELNKSIGREYENSPFGKKVCPDKKWEPIQPPPVQGTACDYLDVKSYRMGCPEWKGQPWEVAELKANGHRVTVVRHADHYDAWGRDTADHLNLAPQLRQAGHLHELFQNLPVGTVLDGELYVEGHHASDVKTWLISPDELLRFAPFAMPFHEGRDCRAGSIHVVRMKLKSFGFEPLQLWSKEALLSRLEHPKDLEAGMLQLARDMKIEGFVLKRAHYDQWYKLKPVRTVDCVVIGTTLSTSQTKFGSLKAIKVAVRDPKTQRLVQIASVGSGFSDDERWALAKIRNTLIGKVCEVEYQDVLSKGKLQFPRFLRWRDDKRAGECCLSQLD